MLKIAVSQVVDARVQDVYAVIVDYQVMNQAILPQPYFEEVVLEEDGQEVAIGVGLTVEVFGHQIHFRQTEGEREDRLAVVEKDMMSDQSITITLDPLDSGRKTRVTITSEMPVSGGRRHSRRFATASARTRRTRKSQRRRKPISRA